VSPYHPRKYPATCHQGCTRIKNTRHLQYPLRKR
jgi:hypothetical protein